MEENYNQFNEINPMEKKDNKRKLLFTLGPLVLVIAFLGISFSWFNYHSNTSDQELIAGDIHMQLNEGNNQISLTNVFPETVEEARSRNDNYITFNITSLNETNKTVYYEFILNHGDDKESPKSRYRDEDLRFDLIELDSNGNEVNYLLSNYGYNNLINKSIWVDSISSNTTSETVKRYKLRMWLSEDVIISDTAPNKTYTTTEYPNKYATIKLTVSGDFKDKSAGAYFDIKNRAVVNNNINFGNLSGANNGEGLFLLKGTDEDVYPIYFYRGAVDNNVIFGGFCWQIVRTTDTGGVKMIYNGVATGNGKTCENTLAEDRIIELSKYNDSHLSMSDVGYMYNTRYPRVSEKAPNDSIFGENVEWDGNNYSLVERATGQTSTSKELTPTRHYTCGLANTTSCLEVRYYYYTDGETYNYIVLSNGDTIEDAIYKMTGNGSSATKQKNASYKLNSIDSKAKERIENWFRINLTNEVNVNNIDYRSYIEDTVYCNDRSFTTVGNVDAFENSGWNPNGTSLSTFASFGTRNRVYNNSWFSTTNLPSTECPNVTDRFQVKNSEAKLNYPVGLLTIDEAVMAGLSGNGGNYNSTYYLYTGGGQWLMSPFKYYTYLGYVFVITSTGRGDYDYMMHDIDGLRPVISLRLGVQFEIGGEGTPTKPYVVKYN